jgi:dolichyl-phosphate-mannose--protein O-mannosyl transferase
MKFLGKNLHSHLFKAPLSGNQEVSGFGDKGSGDTGDNWIVECETKDKYWQRGSVISLKHVDTGKYLTTGESFKFTQQNCGFQCPILVSMIIL